MTEYNFTESFLMMKEIVLPEKNHKQRLGITQPLMFSSPKSAPMGGDPSTLLLCMATKFLCGTAEPEPPRGGPLPSPTLVERVDLAMGL